MRAGMVVIGGLAALAVTAVVLSQSRVRYQNGRYLVAVRKPFEWHEIREFVQPDDPAVIGVSQEIPDNKLLCLDWVCRNIEYRREFPMFWRFPGEVLEDGYGDCNEKSFVLTSLIRRFDNAYVVLGKAEGKGHAWVTDETGYIYEVTYPQALPVADPSVYQPYVFFNDEAVIEQYTGALEDIVEAFPGGKT